MLAIIVLAAFFLFFSLITSFYFNKKVFSKKCFYSPLAIASFLSLLLLIFSNYLLEHMDLKHLLSFPIVLVIVYILAEEMFFRNTLKKLIGEWPQILIYGFLMPFFYAKEINSYVLFIPFLLLLSIFSTYISKKYGVKWAFLFRLFYLAYFALLIYSPHLVISILILNAPFFFLLMEGKKPSVLWKELGLKPFSLSYVRKGIQLFALLFFSIILVTAIIAFLGLLDSHKVVEIMLREPRLTLLISFTLAPVAEETLFRGYLQKRIGIVFSSIIFSALHYGYGSLSEIIAAFSASVILGLNARKEGSIYPAIIAHALWNLLSITVLLNTF